MSPIFLCFLVFFNLLKLALVIDYLTDRFSKKMAALMRTLLSKFSQLQIASKSLRQNGVCII